MQGRTNRAKRSGLKRRDLLKVGGAAAAAALPSRAWAQSKRSIKFTLPWLAQGATAYTYVALDQGMFAKRGLNVAVSRGYGSMAAAQAIAAGQFDFGLVSTGSTIVGAATGLSLVALATTNYDAYMGILVRPESPIRTPKDLNGKKLGGVATSVEAPFWPAFAKLAGIDLSTITYVQTDGRVLERTLMEKQIDASIGIVSTSYAVGESLGVKFRAMLWSDYGLNFYSNNVVTRPEVLEKDPALCQAVTEALLEALAFSLQSPNAALEIFLKQVPELQMSPGGREFSRLGQGFMLASVVRPEAKENGLGYTDLEKVKGMVDLTMQYGVDPAKAKRPDVSTLFSNRFAGTIKLSPEQWAKADSETRAFPKLLG
jgi:NitT/TauT family transport system substrate-binding protein